MALPIKTVGQILDTLFKTLEMFHKTDMEKFKKEWNSDRKKFYKALKAGDSATLAALISKYSDRLP